jgi:hypothetical protein
MTVMTGWLDTIAEAKQVLRDRFCSSFSGDLIYSF